MDDSKMLRRPTAAWIANDEAVLVFDDDTSVLAPTRSLHGLDRHALMRVPEEYWTAWSMAKQTMKTLGFNVRKTGGEWQMTLRPTMERPPLVPETAYATP